MNPDKCDLLNKVTLVLETPKFLSLHFTGLNRFEIDVSDDYRIGLEHNLYNRDSVEFQSHYEIISIQV